MGARGDEMHEEIPMIALHRSVHVGTETLRKAVKAKSEGDAETLARLTAELERMQRHTAMLRVLYPSYVPQLKDNFTSHYWDYTNNEVIAPSPSAAGPAVEEKAPATPRATMRKSRKRKA